MLQHPQPLSPASFSRMLVIITSSSVSHEQVLTVGSTYDTDARIISSNYGPCIDIFAPGAYTVSTWIGDSNRATETLTGTSMACAHVAGMFFTDIFPLHPFIIYYFKSIDSIVAEAIPSNINVVKLFTILNHLILFSLKCIALTSTLIIRAPRKYPYWYLDGCAHVSGMFSLIFSPTSFVVVVLSNHLNLFSIKCFTLISILPGSRTFKTILCLSINVHF